MSSSCLCTLPVQRLHRGQHHAHTEALSWRGGQVLDEIQAGMFDGMTYAQIEQTMPEEFAARKADKLGYR